MRTVALLLTAACLLPGCGTDTVTELHDPSLDDASVIDSADDTTASGETSADASDDTTVPSDTAADVTIADSTADSATDAAKSDSGPALDSSGVLFACGSETCSAKFQFCRKGDVPKTCPPADAGTCPAGCPGCPPASMHCEALPSKCFALPSCMCLVGQVCGFSGSCDEMGGFTVQCKAP